MNRFLFLVLLSSVTGCALKPANQQNSHEVVFRVTIIDGKTTSTAELFAGVPKMIGNSSAKARMKGTGWDITAATSTDKSNVDAMITTLGVAGVGIATVSPAAGIGAGTVSGLATKYIDSRSSGTLDN